MKYYVLHRCEDELHAKEMDASEVLRKLKDDWQGYEFLVNFPDMEYWPERSVLILQGSVVIPRPKSVVTEYAL